MKEEQKLATKQFGISIQEIKKIVLARSSIG